MPPPPRETKHHPASVDLELIKRLLQVGGGGGGVLQVGGGDGGSVLQVGRGREAYCRWEGGGDVLQEDGTRQWHICVMYRRGRYVPHTSLGFS